MNAGNSIIKHCKLPAFQHKYPLSNRKTNESEQAK